MRTTKPTVHLLSQLVGKRIVEAERRGESLFEDYSNLETLDLHTQRVDLNVVRPLNTLNLKRFSALLSTMSEGGHLGTYWAKDPPEFWASLH